MRFPEDVIGSRQPLFDTGILVARSNINGKLHLVDCAKWRLEETHCTVRVEGKE
jgi:hypothetical protein